MSPKMRSVEQTTATKEHETVFPTVPFGNFTNHFTWRSVLLWKRTFVGLTDLSSLLWEIRLYLGVFTLSILPET